MKYPWELAVSAAMASAGGVSKEIKVAWSNASNNAGRWHPTQNGNRLIQIPKEVAECTLNLPKQNSLNGDISPNILRKDFKVINQQIKNEPKPPETGEYDTVLEENKMTKSMEFPEKFLADEKSPKVTIIFDDRTDPKLGKKLGPPPE